MRVIITGGSGLIGQALAADLARDSHEVIIISRRPEQLIGLPAGVRAERWDGRSAEGWCSLADGADAIVNLSGENIGSGRWTAQRKQVILQSRLNAGQAVVEAIKATSHKPRIVIQASGIGYYGTCGDEEITEESPPGARLSGGVSRGVGIFYSFRGNAWSTTGSHPDRRGAQP